MENDEVLDIIKRIRSGETDAFRVLVRQYKNMVYGLALKMCHSVEDAEDVTQDTFIKAYKSIAQFKGKSKFSTWLYQIGYFTAINQLRKQKYAVAEHDEAVADEPDEGVLNKLKTDDQRNLISRSLAYLKPDERAVITLFYLEEHSNDEIAEITKMSLSNVKVKIHRARKKLYGIMNDLMKNELTSLI